MVLPNLLFLLGLGSSPTLTHLHTAILLKGGSPVTHRLTISCNSSQFPNFSSSDRSWALNSGHRVPSSVIKLLSIKTALLLHFLQGPHFKISSFSKRGHLQSCGQGHLLDMASAFQCLVPGLYSTGNSLKADIVSNHRAILSLGAWRPNNHLSTWWSDLTTNFCPNKYCQ